MAALDAPRVPEMPMDEPVMEGLHDGVHIARRGNSAIVDFAPGMGQVSMDDSPDHSADISHLLSAAERATLVEETIEQYEADVQSRRDWQRRLDQAMELLGVNNRPLDDLPFEGASAITYPLLAEACVQFQARAIEELFPSEGPCKTKVVGKVTTDRVEQAERVASHMNYQMAVQDKAYFWHVDQMLFVLPVFGSVFKKTYYDPVSDMVISRMVPAGDFVVPYLATDLQGATRYTHRMRMVEQELKRLMKGGFYQDLPLAHHNLMLDESTPEQESRDRADDRNQSTHYKDNVYEVLEQHKDMEIEADQQRYAGGDGVALPYIVTVDKTTRQLLSVRRNWKESDQSCRKRVWFTHYRYLPGLGFYGFGLLHLIGSIAEGATGSINALLDSAAFANMQGGFVSSDAKIDGGAHHISPGVYKSVKMTAEELSRAFYTPPFKEPSVALQGLFKELVDAGRRFASTTEEMVGDAPNTGPVGTTIALIEQSQKVFSGVHRRLHMAQAEEFQLRAELNYEFLPEMYPYEVEGGEQVVMRQDYDGRVDVIPVSDPNVFSSMQRIAQAQAVVEMASANPDLYDRRKAHERFLKAIRVPDYEELLKNPDAQRKRTDPVTENMLVMMGDSARAFPEQDHDAHIAVHMGMIQGLNREGLETIGPVMQAHLREHYAYKYYVDLNRQLGGQLPPPSFLAGEEEGETPPEVDAMIAQMAAQVPPMQIMPPLEDEGDGDEARKQKAFEAEEERKQKAFEAEQARKDALVDADADRKLASTLTDEERKEEQHRRELVRAEEKARAEAAAKAAARKVGR